MTNEEINPIGFLQEICQKHCYGFPKYMETNVNGPDHCREFTFKCKFEGLETLGVSRQKKQAKSEAAKKMIALMRESDIFVKLKHEIGPKSINTNSDFNHENEVGAIQENEVTFSESKNPISALNEFCQKKLWRPPQFVETSAAGVFVCECILGDKKTYGQGSNKKAAKSEAALRMCVEFNMKCSGVGYLLHESKEEDFFTEKNPVSALQELCAKGPILKTPEYTEFPPFMNLFVVKCTLDSISCEGRGTSKKDAKAEAARQVLMKTLSQGEKSNGPVSAVSALSKVITSGKRQVFGELQDYNVDSCDEDDEEEEGENKKDDLLEAGDVNLSLKLKALSVEPELESKDVSAGKSEETNQAQEEPGEISSLS